MVDPKYAVAGPIGRALNLQRGQDISAALPFLEANQAAEVAEYIRENNIQLSPPLPGLGYDLVARWAPLGPNATVDVNLRAKRNADFVVTSCTYTVGNANTFIGGVGSDVMLHLETNVHKSWTNRPLRLDMLAGGRQFPGYLPAPIRFTRKSVLTCRATNQTAANRWIELQFHGFYVYDEVGRTYPRKPYWYRFDMAPLANARDRDENIMQLGGPFLATYPVGFFTSSAFRWTIYGDSDVNYISGQQRPAGDVSRMHGAPTIGDAQQPWRFDWPRYFGENEQVTVEVEDLSGAPNNITIYLAGIQVTDALKNASPEEVVQALQASGFGY